MGKNILIFVLAASMFILVMMGCESKPGNLDTMKLGSWRNYTISYETAFAAAFENGEWTETKDEKGKNIVQFTGTISKGFHDYAVQQLTSPGEKLVFSSACEYLAALIRDGKISTDPDINFNPSQYPLRNGIFIPALVDRYISSPENKPLIAALVNYYTKVYWATGSKVIFQWGMAKVGRFEDDQPSGGLKASLRLYTISNPFWDKDSNFNGKPAVIMKVIFDYARK